MLPLLLLVVGVFIAVLVELMMVVVVAIYTVVNAINSVVYFHRRFVRLSARSLFTLPFSLDLVADVVVAAVWLLALFLLFWCPSCCCFR